MNKSPQPKMTMSLGKYSGLRRLARADGRFAMIAVDQRPPIINPIAKAHGGEAPFAAVADVKHLLVESLQNEASALLLDPLYCLPKALSALSPRKGLIVTLEAHDFVEHPEGRLSCAIAHWSVSKIKRMGADALKALVWYRPDAAPDIRARQEAWVQSIGEAAKDYDIPFLLELLLYPFDKDPGYVEMAEKHADQVIASVETFAHPRFGVDLFKLESPVPAQDLRALTKDRETQVQKAFSDLDRAASRPWVVLSAGASKGDFYQVLERAFMAGASGYLAGRAIWSDAFKAYPDMERFKADLNGEGRAYVAKINRLLDASARPWFDHPRCQGIENRVVEADTNFPATYPDFP